MKRYFLGLILITVLLFSNLFYPQTFTTTPFITMPGDNTNIDVVSDGGDNSFICWINQVDSIYTLYLKYANPDSAKYITVFSDTAQIANPNIDYTKSSDYNNIRIVWQSFVNNHWQILSREFISDSLTNIVSLTDSLTDNINPELNTESITWIRNGDLIYKFIDSADAKTIILDSANCSNPNVDKSSSDYPIILYEKGPVGNKQIIEAYYDIFKLQWAYNTISKGGDNINPRTGIDGELVSYQVFENGVWKAVSPIIRNGITGNISYNCQNPESFAYPIPVKRSNAITPYFVVYDSDSLKNNKEIMMKTGSSVDTAYNLSNAEGDDYLPYISFGRLQGTGYVVIYWTHDQNGKKDIWAAYTIFNPAFGIVKDPGIIINNFALNQNYPNPFNPSTVISWQLAKGSLVTLKVYDILGNEIATLVNEYQNAGEHSITFDPQLSRSHKLSSGIYLYKLKAGDNVLTKKMMYLK